MFIVNAELNDEDKWIYTLDKLKHVYQNPSDMTHKGRFLMSPKSRITTAGRLDFDKRISQGQKLENEYKFRLAIPLSFHAGQYWRLCT